MLLGEGVSLVYRPRWAEQLYENDLVLVDADKDSKCLIKPPNASGTKDRTELSY